VSVWYEHWRCFAAVVMVRTTAVHCAACCQYTILCCCIAAVIQATGVDNTRGIMVRNACQKLRETPPLLEPFAKQLLLDRFWMDGHAPKKMTDGAKMSTKKCVIFVVMMLPRR